MWTSKVFNAEWLYGLMDDEGEGGGGGGGDAPISYAADSGDHGGGADAAEMVDDSDLEVERLPDADGKQAKAKPKAKAKVDAGSAEPKPDVAPAKAEAKPGEAAELTPPTPEPGPEADLKAWREKADKLAQDRAAQQQPPQQQAQPEQPQHDQQAIYQQAQKDVAAQLRQQVQADPINALTQLGIPPEQIGAMLFGDEGGQAAPAPLAQDPVIQQMQQQIQQQNQQIQQRTEAYQQELQQMQETSALNAAGTFLGSTDAEVGTSRVFGEAATKVFRQRMDNFERSTGMRPSPQDQKMLALEMEQDFIDRETAHLEKLAQVPYWADKIILDKGNGMAAKPASKTLSNSQDDSLAPPKALEEMTEQELEIYGQKAAGLI